jgi:hypothetical protein
VCCDKHASFSAPLFLEIFIVLFILEFLIIKCFLYLKAPDGKVVIDSCDHERRSLVTLEIPQQSADHLELEDDTEQVFVPGRKDDMEVPLIP